MILFLFTLRENTLFKVVIATTHSIIIPDRLRELKDGNVTRDRKGVFGILL